MTAFQPRPGSLAAAIFVTRPPETSIVTDGLRQFGLQEMLVAAAALPARGWTGRSVLLAPDTQLEAAALLIALDGVARRLILAPPDLKPEHFAAVIRDAEADTVITGNPAAFAELGVEIVTAGLPLPALLPVAIATPDATEWLMLTSGTTGEPKIAIHTLAALTGAITAPAERPVWATFYDIRRYGGLQIFLRAMLSGSSLILSRPDEAIQDHLLRLAASGVSHMSGTPTHWRRALMSEAASRFSPRYIRLSGEIADQAILDALKAGFPEASIGHAYASTEAGVGFDVNDGHEGFPASYLDAPVNGVAMRLINGALHIKSARISKGYAGRADLELADGGGWVDTGDMVEVRDGRCYFAGRRGGIINVGGLKVHPEEIETIINRHGAVRQSRVKPRKSPLIGAIVVADIVLAPDTSDAEAVKQDVLSLCRASLPPHKIPAIVNVVAAIEMTAGGKVARGHA
jgi:acyl-coenzyme A synthetase/AMP-(fatty) acid ligase